MLISLLLSGWANQESSRSALERWLKEHPPQLSTWKTVLAEKGFSQVKDLKEYHPILRSLPANLDEEGRIWMDEKALYIAIFQKQGEPWLFKRADPHDPKNKPTPPWNPRGIGWPVLEKLQSELRMLNEAKLEDSGKSRALPKPRDSREIYY